MDERTKGRKDGRWKKKKKKKKKSLAAAYFILSSFIITVEVGQAAPTEPGR